jgi:hypothetical protein
MAFGLTVKCPVCKVEAGQHCKKPRSRPGSHQLRIEAEMHKNKDRDILEKTPSK